MSEREKIDKTFTCNAEAEWTWKAKKTTERLIWIIKYNEKDIFLWMFVFGLVFVVCIFVFLYDFFSAPLSRASTKFFQQQWWYRNRKNVPTSVIAKRWIEPKSDLNTKSFSRVEYVAEHCSLCIFFIYCIKLIKLKVKCFSSHFDLFSFFRFHLISDDTHTQTVKRRKGVFKQKRQREWKVGKCQWKLAKEPKEKRAEREQAEKKKRNFSDLKMHVNGKV